MILYFEQSGEGRVSLFYGVSAGSQAKIFKMASVMSGPSAEPLGAGWLLSVHICIHISLQRSSWTSLYSSPGPQERESRSCRPLEAPNQHSITSMALYWSKQITGQSRLKTGKTLHLLMGERAKNVWPSVGAAFKITGQQPCHWSRYFNI